MSNGGFFLLVFLIQFCENLAWNSSNCSLVFRVRTNNQLTAFPIELQANYTSTCSLENSTVYYVISPLTGLALGRWNSENADEKSIVLINSTQWTFLINESSTIRLCIRAVNAEQNNRLCRQLHIGISQLQQFWHFPMEIFYICTLVFVGGYYLFYRFVYIRCRKQSQKVHSVPSVVQHYRRTDTFECEKVHSQMSDEE